MERIKLPVEPDSWLSRWANRMRAYYGHPVYLVGSQLTDKEIPSDVDVICIIPDNEFQLRFCDVGLWHHEIGTCMFTEKGVWGWSDRCIKDALDGMAHTQMPIDFKVYCQTYANAFKDKPKVRIDTR